MHRDNVVRACKAIYGSRVNVRIDITRIRRKVITTVKCNGHRLLARGVGTNIEDAMRNLLTVIIVGAVHILEFESVKGEMYVNRVVLRDIIRSTDHLSSVLMIVGDPE